jgi:hypothetical protein
MRAELRPGSAPGQTGLSSSITLTVALGALLSLAAAGCNDESSGGCAIDADCDRAAGEVCLTNGQCGLECFNDRECDDGLFCVQNACQGPGATCVDDIDCAPFRQVCDRTSRRCVNSNGALPDGQDAGGQPPWDAASGGTGGGGAGGAGAGGAGPGGGGPGGGGPGGGTGGGGPQPDAAVQPPRDAAVDPGPDACVRTPPGPGFYGDLCQTGADCMTSWCVENKLRAARTCTSLCRDDAECPGTDRCIGVEFRGRGDGCPPEPGEPMPGDIVNVCIPDETGFPCNPAQGCTPGNTCLTLTAPVPWVSLQPICARECPDGRCPNGYQCTPTPNGQGGMVNVCAPAIAGLAQCNDPVQCGGVCPNVPGVAEADRVLCAVSQLGPGGYCTCGCGTSAHCPEGSACDDRFPSGVPGLPGTCVPIAGLMCPNEVEGMPSQCFSATCLEDDDSSFLNRCTTICTGDAQCPRDYRCQAVGNARACILQ